MKEIIVDERSGLWYELRGEQYFPCVTAPESPRIGIWGERRRRYLREYQRLLYDAMRLSGQLNDHLEEIDRAAEEMLSRLVEQMASKQGITEKLKAEHQMEWVQKMNAIQSSAKEIVYNDLIYA